MSLRSLNKENLFLGSFGTGSLVLISYY